MDDESGYDHITLSEESRKYFAYNGKAGILFTILSPSVGRVARTSTILSAWLLPVTSDPWERLVTNTLMTQLCAFLLPKDKKIKFAIFRKNIVANREVSVKTLQSLAGKISSFCIEVPAALLYARDIFWPTADRILELRKIRSNKPYEKQKSCTHRELVRFLASLPTHKCLSWGHLKIPHLE